MKYFSAFSEQKKTHIEVKETKERKTDLKTEIKTTRKTDRKKINKKILYMHAFSGRKRHSLS